MAYNRNHLHLRCRQRRVIPKSLPLTRFEGQKYNTLYLCFISIKSHGSSQFVKNIRKAELYSVLYCTNVSYVALAMCEYMQQLATT